MKIEFIKTSPTQNMTIIVKTPVPRDKQFEVGMKLMDYASVNGEQAGFLETPYNPQADIRLQMMAGEFCGNGTMSAAAYVAREKGIQPGETMRIFMEVSGSEGIVSCKIEALNNKFRGTVNMPLPKWTESREYVIENEKYMLKTIFFPGIRHIILPKEIAGDNYKKKLEMSVDSLRRQNNDEAFGIIVLDEKEMSMEPLVVVKSSVFWERCCGSGSAAVGVYIAEKKKQSAAVSIKEPGGIMEVIAKYDNGIKSVSISGNVAIVAEGKAYI
ncbi:diaminopimelate epimerase [Clostridiales bacterium]|nr:diaminopimelate epimerase [Clostridiales bacterium]